MGTGIRKWGKAAIFAGLISAVLLVGCTGRRRTVEVQEEEKVLEIMMHVDDSFPVEDNAYLEALEERMGCRISVRRVPFNSYNEYLSVVMASEGRPDIVQFNWNGEEMFSAWAERGLIRPIDLERAENIRINVPEAQQYLMKVRSDGELYGVPGTTSTDYFGVVIRKDWLDTLGLDVPVTLGEYEEVLRRFVSDDPDGDFRVNTIGMTSWKLNHYCGVFGSAFQTDYLWNSMHPDMAEVLLQGRQTAVLREQQSGYMEMMDYVKYLYDEGLLDKDFETLQNAETRFLQGKIGMIGAYTRDVLTLEKKLKETVPEAELIWTLPPGDSEGRVWNFMPAPYGYAGAGALYGKNSVFVITKDGDYDLALSFLDMMNTKEMILFANLGVKGIHYEEYDENRKIVKRTAEQSRRADKELFGVSDTYRGEPYSFLWDNQEESEKLNYCWKKGNLLITNPKCYSMGLSDVGMDFLKQNPFFREMERNNGIAYVTGAMDRENYERYIGESIEARKAVLYDIQQKYRKLTE